MKYNFENTFKDLDLDDIENRRFAAKQLLSKINKISNKIEQNFWLKRLSQKIDVPENILRETIESAPSRDYSAPEPDSPTKKTAAPKTREEILSESFLALLLKFPDLIEYAMDQVNIDQLPGLANEDIYKNLVIYYNSLIDSRTQRAEEGEGRPSIEYSGFKSWLEKNISPQKNISQPALNSSHNSFGLLDRLVLLGERDYYNLNNEQARSELIKIIAVLKKNYLRSRMREITKLISESEQAGDSQKAQELMAELKLLSDEEKAIG